jgi:hypothetical protein
MKRLTGLLVLVVFVAASGAEAFSWPSLPKLRRAKRLPQPIDSPIVRPKNKSADHRTTRMHHKDVYDRYGWGTEWNKTLNVKHAREGNHSIFQD